MSTRLVVLLVASFGLILGVLSAQAQEISSVTLEQVKKYVEAKQQEVESSSAGPGSYNDPPFYMGSPKAIIELQMMNDMQEHANDFYLRGGSREAIIGLCCSDFSVWPYIEYYHPWEMVEVAGMLQGQYLPREIATQWKQVIERFWFRLVVLRMLEEAQFIQGENSPGVPGFSAVANLMRLFPVKKKLDSFLLRPPMGHHNPWMRRQYHVFQPLVATPQHAEVINTFTGDCHVAPPMPPVPIMRSDNPLFITFTNLASMSELDFKPEIDFLNENPGACLANNLAHGVSSVESFGGLAQELAPGVTGFRAIDVCLPTHGRHFPITTRTNARSFMNAASILFMKADNFFNEKFPGIKSDYAYYEHPAYEDMKVDNIRWHHPSDFPDSPTTRIDEYGDFRDGSYPGSPSPGEHAKYEYVSSPDKSDPYRAVATTWKYIRCCPPGYDVCAGPKPQLQGPHPFPGGRIS